VNINTYAIVFFGFPVGPDDVPFKTWELYDKLSQANLKGVEAVEYGSYDRNEMALAIARTVKRFDLETRSPVQTIPLHDSPLLPVKWAETLKKAALSLGIRVSSEPQWYFTAQQG